MNASIIPTAWDEFGSVRPDGSDVQHYDGAGLGLNELWEGPEGEIYATRYVGSIDGSKNAAGAVAVFGADGRHRREFAFPKAPDGSIICPKSLAVDPQRRDIWLTSDLFHADGRARRPSRVPGGAIWCGAAAGSRAGTSLRVI